MKTQRWRRRVRPRVADFEGLEPRRMLAASILGDPVNPGEWIVTIVEDRPGTSDTLQLRASPQGKLELSLNGRPATADLDSTAPGVQALAVGQISKIVVALGRGNDLLVVDNACGAVVPVRDGLFYDGGSGFDSLQVVAGAAGSYAPGPSATDGLVVVDGRSLHFTGIEPTTVSGLSSFTFVTPRSADVLTIDSPGSGKNRISGTSDGLGFEALTFYNVTSFTLDAAQNDGAAPDDTITLSSSGLVASGLRDFTLLTGAGQDSFSVASSKLTRPVAGGAFTFDAGAGADRLAAAANVSYTLTDAALSSSAGGSLALIGVDQARLTGGNSGNRLDASGFSGPTTLDGGNGDDTILGGSGNDVLAGGNGTEVIYGNAGDDTISGGNGTGTLFGGSGNDLLQGDNGTDWLYGEDGDDTITGGNGDDLLDGGSGNDLLQGDNGTDVLYGRDGDDVLSGGNGGDLLDGGADNDRLSGQLGDDAILGGSGIDTVTETSNSNFTLSDTSLYVPGLGTDLLDQVEQAELVAGPSANTLNAAGFSGSVTFDGGGGDDVIIGGTGTNRYVLGRGGAVTINANGHDALDFTRATSAVTLDLGLDAGTAQEYVPGASLALSGSADEVAGSDQGNTFIGGNTPSLLFGGAGNDSIVGGSGSNTIVGGGGRNTLFGGTGNDSIVGGSGSNTIVGGGGSNTLFGGVGDDSIVGGDGSNTISGGGGRNTLFGGAGNDSIVGGSGSNTIVGGGGRNTLFGGTGDDSIVGGNGSNTISGGGGRNTLFGGTGNDSIVGGSGSSTIVGGGGRNTLYGGEGDDSIVGGSGGVALFVPGSNVIRGGPGNDVLTGGSGDDIIFGGPGFDSIFGDQGGDVLFGGEDTPGEDGGDVIFGGPDDDYIIGGAGDDWLDGGTGDDTYRFPGESLGSDTLDDPADADADWLDFSSFAGPVALDLALATLQVVHPAHLSLTFTPATAIAHVTGSAFGDSLAGNSLSNRLAGADPLDDRGGPAPAWDGVEQWVYLDFDTFTGPGEYAYSEDERAAIQARIVDIYAAFHFRFTRVLVTIPIPDYATLFFNKTPIVDGVPQPGGQADELDWRNVNPGGTAAIDVNGLLGGDGQPEASSPNFVALSATVAAHELGHLVGLRHDDAFGPIGTGVNDPPGTEATIPAYPGPYLAYETRYHLMASPASAGTSLEDAIAGPFLGEREAVKIAFAESGTLTAEQAAPHRSIATAQALNLVSLAVPNTLLRGLNAGKAFAVAASNVLGSIELVAPEGVSENDFYSFQGRAGDLINAEVFSRTLTGRAVSPILNPIDAILRLYDAAGSLVAYYTAQAENDDGFEGSTDSILVDLVLPADGTYFLEVDTFSTELADSDIGQYELFVSRFDTGNVTDTGDQLVGRGAGDVLIGILGNDTLDGGAGDDLLDGGSGDDTYIVVPGGTDAILDSSGRDRLDFSGAASGVSVNLGLNAGQAQTLNVAGDVLRITGIIDIVIGTAFADQLTAATVGTGVVLFGGSGADSMTGGTGADVLVGGAGNDTITGGDGRDVVIGGDGSDKLTGGGDDDILIGGRTSFDADLAALDAILAEWNSPATYKFRVDHLIGAAPGGLNGSYRLIPGTTVFNDGVKDTLTGGLGVDMFFVFPLDQLTDFDKKKERKI
jgi:Ca2+-binding RTX toxin-like protein